MGTRERTMEKNEVENCRERGPGEPAPDPLRHAGEQLLAAADRAIERTLSPNSESFLRASRQEGGQ
jgi:hypothetical protein